MSLVKFKKLSCRMSLNYARPMSRVGYPHATCQNSEIPYIVSYIFLAMSLRAMRMSILRNGRVAVSDLGVKDPPALRITQTAANYMSDWPAEGG